MADKGKGKLGGGALIRIVGAVAVVALVAVSSVFHLTSQRKELAEIAAAWTITGAACPTPPADAATTPPPRGLVYEEITFLRERGAINCNTIRPDGTGPETPVCMFMGPGALRITTAKGVFDYAPRAGVPATVTVRDGQPECVTHFNRALFN